MSRADVAVAVHRVTSDLDENFHTRLKMHVARTGADHLLSTIELRARKETYADARLFLKSKDWRTTAVGRELVEALKADTCIADLRCEPSALSLRFKDEALRESGAKLERGETGPLSCTDYLAGSTYLVGFVEPNTCKALHAGHLRNIVLGHALAAILERSGACVLRHSLVGDVGRNVCEAIAGLRLIQGNRDPAMSGMKPDHFIGMCYSDFCRIRNPHGKRSANADPVLREFGVVGDEADALMSRWLAGDPEIHNTWRRVREVVLDGHQQSLHRLGVYLDRCDFESESMADIPGIIEAGLRSGVLQRRDDGAVVFCSGRAEYGTMVLVRSDGFPTEHARLIATYRRIVRHLPQDTTYIDLAGNEWQAASRLHARMLVELAQAEDTQYGRYLFLFHGMVNACSDGKISSSLGGALLLDEILDRAATSNEVTAAAALSGGLLDPEELAVTIVKLFFLCQPLSKTIDFTWESLMSERQNPAWRVVRAWCDIHQESKGQVSECGDDYRRLVLMSHGIRECARNSAKQLSSSALTRYLVRLCELLNDASIGPAACRMMRTILADTLESIGVAAPVDESDFVPRRAGSRAGC